MELDDDGWVGTGVFIWGVHLAAFEPAVLITDMDLVVVVVTWG